MRICLPDVNILIALHDPQHTGHDAAHEWFTSATYGSGGSISAPSPWVQIYQSSGSAPNTAFFYIPNAASRSGTETVSISTTCYAVMALGEFSGVATSNVLDGTYGTASGYNVNTLSGTTPTTTNSGDLIVAFISVEGGGNNLQKNPTNGFTLAQSLCCNPIGDANLAFLYKVPGTKGKFSTGTTLSGGLNCYYLGVIQAFFP